MASKKRFASMFEALPFPSIYFVIPAWNEGERLPKFLDGLAKEFGDGRSPKVVFQVVDDGSAENHRDAMGAALRHLEPTTFLPMISLPRNRGKGGAIMEGWALERTLGYDWIGFLDADGAISPREVKRVIAHLQRRETLLDGLFASRIKMLGRVIKRKLFRHLIGRVFATLIGCRIDARIYDSQCGMKLIRRSIWEKIAGRVDEMGFAFDIDLLAALNSVGARLEEVPIDWEDVAGSKVRVLRDAIRMARATQRIRQKFQIE